MMSVVTQRTISQGGSEGQESQNDIVIDKPKVLALIRPLDMEAMSELVTLRPEVDICGTSQDFIKKHTASQYQVAILPVGMLSETDRMLLRSYLTSIELHPSVLLYSSEAYSSHGSGWLEGDDISIVMRPFTERRLREAIAYGVQEFVERSNRRRC